MNIKDKCRRIISLNIITDNGIEFVDWGHALEIAEKLLKAIEILEYYRDCNAEAFIDGGDRARDVLKGME